MLQEAHFDLRTIRPHNLEERLPLPAIIEIDGRFHDQSVWTEENFDFARVEALRIRNYKNGLK